MADILTHLRELGVGYGILRTEVLKNNPKKFLVFCHENIKDCSHLKHENITRNKVKFSKEEYAVLLNAFKLGRHIHSLDIINNEKPIITWQGKDTQSGTPFDLMVDSIPFSLKEDSFILHNMGLSRLLNILTDSSDYKRGLHIFKEYASEELTKWFKVARDEAIISLKNQSFEYCKLGNYMKMAYSEEALILDINGYRETIDNFSTCDYERYQKETTNKYREKVFSKFINKELQDNQEYLEAKVLCSEKAGKNLTKLINEKINKHPSPETLYNLFRINDVPYYYAKNGNGINEVYFIPSKHDFTKNIEILSVHSSVPKSQLNILTTIKNKTTGKKLVIRNELRYSHGQLNGTPEAKMYIDDGSLEIAYKKIECSKESI